jgi:hypothetical protein
MMGGTDDVVLPIVVANPMAKEHAIVKLDELFALGADDIGANAMPRGGFAVALADALQDGADPVQALMET